ncbi:MAG: hypothetical protein EZS28_012272 [Streblomastix strix]|uniref:SPRY domain-containing protein n=1 Tax=Streblomastix strix TaxID=222440 RepID=A0A5J4WBK9_9EUKA|nr:MAG: hypothetical protein EZS28_012272 [Streblomastix strix]
MAVPSEYNVIKGLLGLGPDILLEILSKFRLVSNAVQFLGVCKKTCQLMYHNRFSKIVETLNYPTTIVNKDPQDVQLIEIDDVQKKINKKKDDYSTISLVQVIDNGIWSFEVMFPNMGQYGKAVGIVRDSYGIPAKANYYWKHHTDHIAAFCGTNNYVWYKGQGTKCNAGFDGNQIFRLEFDSFKGTLILFIDNVQQPVYFSGIKEKIRFIISMNYAGQVCIIRSLNQLIAPTSVHIANQVAIQW